MPAGDDLTATGNTAAEARRLAVLGSGPIGRTVGRRWVEAGHTVAFGSRAPDKLGDLIDQLGPRSSAHSWREAVTAADVVLLAVAYPGVAAVLEDVCGGLAEKILIDATNPMGLDPDGRIVSTLPCGVTQGAHIAALLPHTRVVRAFTHVMAELLDNRGRTQPLLWAMAIAGDDADALSLTADLVRDAGFTPVPIGSLVDSAALDPGGVLFPHMYTAADLQAVLTS